MALEIRNADQYNLMCVLVDREERVRNDAKCIQISEILNIENIFRKFMKNITVSEHKQISVKSIHS